MINLAQKIIVMYGSGFTMIYHVGMDQENELQKTACHW